MLDNSMTFKACTDTFHMHVLFHSEAKMGRISSDRLS